MATTYSVADEHDNTAGYSTVSPSPYTEGIYYGREIVAISGQEYDDGTPHVWLEWRNLKPSEVVTLLAAYGLTNTPTNQITHALPDDDRSTFSDYNCRAVFHRNREYMVFRDHIYRVFRIKLKELVAAT